MKSINRKILEQVITVIAEPVMIVRVDHTDWPVVLANPAFESMGGGEALNSPFADVIEGLVGRDLALEISESLRSKLETSFPVEIGGREYLLVLKPLLLPNEEKPRFYSVLWRGGNGSIASEGSDTQHALLKAKRRIRDLSRDDPVTGLLNARAFRDVLEHDWAVASREKSTLALVLFTLDDYDEYVDIFGKHASDSCLRRVGQAIRRCLRRASDVVARLEDSQIIVLSHASDEASVREFADKIATAVRELGLHHPRSSSGRFVVVSHRIALAVAGEGKRSAADFLKILVASDSR